MGQDQWDYAGGEAGDGAHNRGWGVQKVFIRTPRNGSHLKVVWALAQIREYVDAGKQKRPMRILPERQPRYRVLRHGEGWERERRLK